MSPIFALLDLTSPRPKAERLARAAGAIGAKARRVEGALLDSGPIFLGRILLRTAGGDEHCPPVHRSGAVSVVADVRLDNQDELRRTLPERLPPQAPPEAFLAAAYRHWGESFPRFLVGDYAFALWDDARRLLVAGRDPLGMRPLFYRQRDGLLIVASGLDLLREPGVVETLDLDLLRDLLDRRYERWSDQTAVSGASRLPMGHRLEASGGRVSLCLSRRLGETRGERYPTAADYAERLRELLEESVACRLGGAARGGVLTSGGLDSSALAVLADRLVARGYGAGSLALYSAVFPQTPSADESAFLRRVAAACPRSDWHPLPADDCWALREDEENVPAGDEPAIEWSEELLVRLLAAARRDGVQVLLTGYGADQLLSSPAYLDPRYLSDVPPRQWWQEWRHFVRHRRHSAPLFAAAGAAAALLPPPLLAALWRASSRRRGGTWSSRATFRGLGFAATRAAHALTAGIAECRNASWQRLRSHFGIEIAHPFLDLRVVDFVLRLPRGLRFGQGQRKALLRQAMEGLLPEPVRLRNVSTHFGDLLARGLVERERRRLEGWLDDPALAAVGLLGHGEVRRRWSDSLQGCPGEGRYPGRAGVVMIYLERWLRARGDTATNGIGRKRLAA